MKDPQERSAVATRYPYLKGLLGIPIGFSFAVVAIATYRWWPWSGGGHGLLVIGPALVAAGIAYWAIARYYQANYGRVVVAKRERISGWFLGIAGAATIVVASVLGEVFHLPVNLYGVAFVVVIVGTWRYQGVLRAHHLLLAAGLLVVSLLPLGGTGFVTGTHATTSMTLVLLGVAVVTSGAGLIDHAYLVRWLGPATPAAAKAAGETSHVGR